MKLAELLSSEVADLPRDTAVIVPVASLEQHSLHLPVFTDSLILEECIRRLENRLSDTVLVLPVMWLGYSQHHMPYPGTVSASSDTHQNRVEINCRFQPGDDGTMKIIGFLDTQGLHLFQWRVVWAGLPLGIISEDEKP